MAYTVEKQKEYQKEYYKRNKEKIKQQHDKWRKENKTRLVAWFTEYKSTLSCIRCGETFGPCLQFHHRDPAKKRFTISGAVRMCVNREEILAEIMECDVLCGNCHVKRHYQR